MISERFFNQVLVVLALSFSLLGMGCQFSGTAKKLQNPGAAEPPKSDIGTVDSGGCNGTSEGCYDSYIIKTPLELPAYKEHLAPIFEKIKTDSKRKSDDSGGTSDGIDLAIFAEIKTWYVAPVNLKTLDKKTLGLSFSSDNSQQLAIQTGREIWIDSRTYEKMTTENQAKLLLHEMVMNLYLVKYKKYSELCKAFDKGATDSACSKDIDELWAPLFTEAPLNGQDYANIRNMTGWLWFYGKTAKNDEIFQKFLSNDFDPRLFRNMLTLGQKTEELSAEKIAEMIENAILLNKGPTECQSLNLGQKIPCKFEAKPVPLMVQQFPTKGLQLTAHDFENKALFDEAILLNGSSKGMFLVDVATGDNLVLFPLSSHTLGPKAVRGARFRMSFALFKISSAKKFKDPQFHSIISIPGVVTKVEDMETNGYKGKFCHAERPRPTGFEDDIVALVPSETNTSYLKWFGNAMKGLYAPCW